MGTVVHLQPQSFQNIVQESLHALRPDYTIIDCLGSGSFGIVYEIENQQKDTLCLKVLATPGVEKPKVLAAVETLGVSGILEREKYPKILHHPNLVDVVESITITIHGIEIPCVIQKKIEGQTLETFLRQTNPKERRMYFATIAQGIAAGIGCIHTAEIVHRDIKPDNVIIDIKSRRPRIFDFSIAEKTDQSGIICNSQPATPSQYYSAPEVREKKKDIDARRADIWSMGLLFYEYLTGDNPRFDEDIHILDALLPRRYRTIINKCLNSNPEKRYKDGNDLYKALQQAEWYYAKRSALGISISTTLLALLAFPLGVDTIQRRITSEYTNHCIAAIEAGDLDKADYTCEQALLWDDQNCIASINQGHLLFLQRKTEEAKAAYSVAQQYCGDDRPKDTDISVSSAVQALAVRLRIEGKRDEAKELLEILKEISPRKDAAYSGLLAFAIEDKDYAEATLLLTGMKDKKNIPAGHFYELAFWHKEQGHLDTALQFASTAVVQEREQLGITPNALLSGLTTKQNMDTLARSLFLTGDIYLAKGAYPSALEAYHEANTIRPDRPDAFVTIASAWFLEKKYSEAKELLERAEKIYIQKIEDKKTVLRTVDKNAEIAPNPAELFRLYSDLLYVYQNMKKADTYLGISLTSANTKIAQTKQEMKMYLPASPTKLE